jgi:hypothetical protein
VWPQSFSSRWRVFSGSWETSRTGNLSGLVIPGRRLCALWRWADDYIYTYIHTSGNLSGLVIPGRRLCALWRWGDNTAHTCIHTYVWADDYIHTAMCLWCVCVYAYTQLPSSRRLYLHAYYSQNAIVCVVEVSWLHCTYIHTYIHTCVCVYAYAYNHILLGAFTYIHTHVHIIQWIDFVWFCSHLWGKHAHTPKPQPFGSAWVANIYIYIYIHIYIHI